MATLEGTLSKWTNVMKGWQNRWFVLEAETSLLSYYTVSCKFLSLVLMKKHPKKKVVVKEKRNFTCEKATNDKSDVDKAWIRA